MQLLTYNLDQHPFPSPAVKTPVSATQLTPQDPFPRAKGSGEQSETIQPAVRRRDHHGCASRPITRNIARCVLLQVRVSNLSLDLGQASSPVRLCNRPIGRRRR